MSTILTKRELAPKIWEYTVSAPRIAARARPGQFVIVMADGGGERIPLTIADFDRAAGTITLVLFVIGAGTRQLSQLEPGGDFHAVLGPLGEASEIRPLDSVVLVAGGVGAAPVYPIARGFREAGCRVLVIQGARTRDLLFWTDRLASVSDRHLITTDDGTAGRSGRVTDTLRELLEADPAGRIAAVYAIGPPVMMRACAETTRGFAVKTIVSLNTVMIDGTGMCGGCRVEVGGRTRFTCVDGPEFDGHQVDWDLFFSRQRTYHDHERCALEQVS